jgi:hypothetical protein
MCTLIIGRDVLGPHTVVLAANRDEDPARPSDPPMVLNEDPWVVGGRDRVAGGTWLAVRENQSAVALLNRYEPDFVPQEGQISRGQLALEVAALSSSDLPQRMYALSRVGPSYAPFTLVFASRESCWEIHNGYPRRGSRDVAAGWSVLTHRDLNDPTEPRTAHLLERLRGFEPNSLSEAEERLGALLRSHGEDGSPPVCIHEGRMVTVSSSIVAFETGKSTYLHADGRPCEHAYQDMSALLTRPAAQKGSHA